MLNLFLSVYMYIFFIMFKYVYSKTFSLSLGFSGLGNSIGRWSVHEMIDLMVSPRSSFFTVSSFELQKVNFKL